MNNAEKQRRYRDRKKAGLRILKVAIEEEAIEEGVRRGYLDIRATEHDPALEEAIANLIHRWIYREVEKNALPVTNCEKAPSECSQRISEASHG